MNKIYILLTVLFFLGSAKAKDTVIVLQNGLDGYNGCTDSYTFNGYYNDTFDSTNYGDDTLLTVFFGNNGSR